jgi:pyridoxamine 5'-phosphate oxidase
MSPDPLFEFEHLYEEAHSIAGEQADVVALATASRADRPSVRMVLYRGIREGGLSFFTNYESRKGIELSENPFAAMAFYWEPLGKQVRVEGRVERLSPEESDRYFASRPLESRVSAAVSPQSRPMLDEAAFLSNWNEMLRSAAAHGCARPPTWGGFKLIPERFEFWTRGEHRRHHRLVYEKAGESWHIVRLYP